jgi:prepilin-type N-terminal cleavage/methylation domain-containing protein
MPQQRHDRLQVNLLIWSRKMNISYPATARSFTLIELLIVVAIIAILAAIAVPNFLEAQTRSKVSRVKSDMRSLNTAIESYHVDNNAWPTSFGDFVDGNNPDGSHSLYLLSTPIAYMSTGDIQDPFVERRDDTTMFTTYQWDPMTADGRMISAWNKSLGHIAAGEKATWWLLLSNGPDLRMGFTSSFGPTDPAEPDNPESNVQVIFAEAGQDPDALLGTIYDPTNGTKSVGNIYRAGGSGTMNRAGHLVMQAQ